MDLIIILRAIIALPIIFFIPGYVTFNAFRMSKIENLDLSLDETVFLQIVGSMVITGWGGIILASFGYFSILNLCGLLLFYSFITTKFRSYDSLNYPKLRLNAKKSFFWLILAVMAVSLLFHPSQEITGRHDIGVYINTGINIAKTGSITMHDSIIKNMPNTMKTTFYQIDESLEFYDGYLFPDFPIINKTDGVIMPLQPPLHQIWVAIFYSIFGLYGALCLQPVLGFLSILSVFLLTRFIYGWKVGMFTASLLTINFIQIFFSQYNSPEILFQLLIFSGIFTFMIFMRSSYKFFAILSAALFAQLFFTRIDAIFILFPICLIAAFTLTSHKSNKCHFSRFAIPFILFFFHYLIYSMVFLIPYHIQLLRAISNAYKLNLTSTAMLISIFAILIIFFLGIIKFHHIQLKNVRYIDHFFASLMFILIIYSFITLPSTQPGADGQNLLVLSWFLSPIGIALALLALILTIYKKPRNESYMFLLFILPYLLLYIHTIANTQSFPWALRRYITVVIPAFIIFISYSIYKIYNRISTLKNNKILLPLLILYLISFSVIMDKTLTTAQFDGFITQVDDVAEFFDNNSIILDDNRFTDVTLSMPLKFIYEKNAIYLWDKRSHIYDFTEMTKLWGKEGKDVFYIVYPNSREVTTNTDLSPFIDMKLEKVFIVNVSTLKWNMDTFSNTRTDISYPIKVYRLIPAASE